MDRFASTIVIYSVGSVAFEIVGTASRFARMACMATYYQAYIAAGIYKLVPNLLTMIAGTDFVVSVVFVAGSFS